MEPVDFEKHGFKSGEVRFPGLEIIVDIGPGNYFRNDGLVGDVNSHAEKIKRKMGIDKGISSGDDVQGRCLRFRQSYTLKPTDGGEKQRVSERGAVVFVQGMSPEVNLFNQGHESTHALIHLGYPDVLLSLMRMSGFSLNPFEAYRDMEDPEELVAHVGGLIALYKAGGDRYLMMAAMKSPGVSPLVEDLLDSRVYSLPAPDEVLK